MKNIIAQNKKYVRAIIYKLTGQQNQDIEQEAYIKIWQNLPQYQEQGRFKQWIGMITANICRDYFRSKSFKMAHQQENDDVIEQVSDNSQPAEEIIDSKTRQKIILKAVDDLPKVYRQVIVLFEFEEFPIEKIAARLKIPVGTVKSRLHHARKILKERLSFLQKGD